MPDDLFAGFKKNNGRWVDLTGQRFGDLTVLSYLPPDVGVMVFPQKKRKSYWLVRCTCGVHKYVAGANIKRTRSCGCQQYAHSAENLQKAMRARKIEDRIGFLVGRVSNAYRNNSKKRGIVWSLSRSDVRKFILADCHYCGSGLSNILNTKNNFGEIESLPYNGIDRVDNDKGYVQGNVVPCCKICNTAKFGLSLAEFYDWVARVSSRIPDPA